MGGDEFSIVGIDYDEEQVDEVMKRFESYLEAFNEKSGLPYLIKASYGYYIISESDKISLEAAVVKSDNNLYERKREKKARKLDGVLRESNV